MVVAQRQTASDQGKGLDSDGKSYYWNGRCEKLARRKLCVHEKWWNAGLLDVWTEVDDVLADSFAKSGAEPIPDGQPHVVPYAAIEHLLWDQF